MGNNPGLCPPRSAPSEPPHAYLPRPTLTLPPGYGVPAKRVTEHPDIDRARTPPVYTQARIHANMSRPHEASLRLAQAYPRDDIQYGNTGPAAQPRNVLSTQHLQAPVQAVRASSPLSDHSSQMELHGQGDNSYFHEDPESAATYHHSQETNVVEIEQGSHFHAIPAPIADEEEGPVHGLIYSESTMPSIQHIQGTPPIQPQMWLDAMPHHGSLAVTPQGLGRFYPAYSFGLPAQDLFFKDDEPDPSYPLPHARTSTIL